MGKKAHMRLRSGTAALPNGKFGMVIALWGPDDPDGVGPPIRQLYSNEEFDTLDEAEKFYFKFGRQRLRKIQREIEKGMKPGSKLWKYEGDPLPLDRGAPLKDFEPVQTSRGPVTLHDIDLGVLHMKYRLPPNPLADERAAFITSDELMVGILFVDVVDNEPCFAILERRSLNEPLAVQQGEDVVVNIRGDARAMLFNHMTNRIRNRA